MHMAEGEFGVRPSLNCLNLRQQAPDLLKATNLSA